MIDLLCKSKTSIGSIILAFCVSGSAIQGCTINSTESENGGPGGQPSASGGRVGAAGATGSGGLLSTGGIPGASGSVAVPNAAGVAGASTPSLAGAAGAPTLVAVAGNAGVGVPVPVVAGAAGTGGVVTVPPVAGAAGAGPQGCGTVTELGQCNKDNLVYCENAVLQTLDCASIGSSCQVIGGSATCQAPNRALSCGDLTKLGTCDGAVIRYCDETGLVGVPKSIDCAAYGQICNPTAAKDGGALCVPQGACPSGVTKSGVCTGNHLRFCDYSTNPDDNSLYLYDFDCGLDECRALSSGFSDCFMASVVTGCGTETAAGRCDGQTRVTCPGNTVIREDCAALGLECRALASGAVCQRAATCPVTCPSGYSCKSGVCSPNTAPTREWTFAVYTVGDNNLSDAAWYNLNQMESVGSNASRAIVAQVEYSQKYSNRVPPEYLGGTYRLVVNQDTDPYTVTSMASAQSIGTTNMSDPASLSDFLKWVAATYPAKHLALIMWNHGMGYEGGFADESTPGDATLSLKQITAGIANSGVHPDLVGFDACLMAMHEVGLAMRGVTDWMVASEEIEPGSGYPYHTILSHLVDNPALTPQDFGKAIVDEYGIFYANSSRKNAATQSLTDLSKISSLNDSLQTFAGAMASNLAQDRLAVLDALDNNTVVRYRMENNADIRTAMTAMQAVGGPIGTAAEAVNSVYDSSKVVANSKAVFGASSSTGLALFYPKVGFGASELEQYRSDTSFLPLQGWHTALANLRNNESAAPAPGTGAVDSFSVILSWANAPDGKKSGSDLDLYVYEPSGDFAVPVNGSVSENGVLSGDSYDTGVPSESYKLKPDHTPGTYIVLVHFYDGPKGESAYPRLQLFRPDLPGGSRNYVRGKVTNKKLTEVPMNATKPLTTMIDETNFAGVQNLDYSNIWYAFTVEVK